MREGNGAAERHDRVQRYVPPLNEGTLPPTFGPAAALPQNGEPRRTLHLSSPKTVLTMLIHSTKIPHGPNMSGSGERLATRPPGNQLHSVNQPGRHGPTQYAPGRERRTHQHDDRASQGGRMVVRSRSGAAERVDGDITAFLAAFDAALADGHGRESCGAARGQPIGCLRAGARTRIELERLRHAYRAASRRNTRHRLGDKEAAPNPSSDCRPLRGGLALNAAIWGNRQLQRGAKSVAACPSRGGSGMRASRRSSSIRVRAPARSSRSVASRSPARLSTVSSARQRQRQQGRL